MATSPSTRRRDIPEPRYAEGSTGAENAAINWHFRVGDQVKIRLVEEMDSDHPMPYPFHIHSAGRFLLIFRFTYQAGRTVAGGR
jgi:hypothetical protein